LAFHLDPVGRPHKCFSEQGHYNPALQKVSHHGVIIKWNLKPANEG